jgi:uncharacterized protein (TIGR00299 family) protein
MFVAALLDAWPELETEVRRALESVQLPPSVSARALPHKDHTLQGTRFCVEDANAGHGHAHTAFREIRERLCDSALTPPVRERAIDIFTLLAAAEGRVHGLPPEQVRFHEVGAWDSIADIVAAAQLIETSGATAWSLSSLPLGSGRVQTAHGSLPVPAPATALLLEGLPVHDDGLEGERVTPTGAAILRHLSPAYRAPAEPMRITRTGIGFGTKRFPGISNVLRLLALEDVEPALAEESIAVLRFEVDDQPAEDLAVGLERLRELDGVLDVLQSPAYGKKGRLCIQVQLLARSDALDRALRGCFIETTTLGVRFATERRALLERSSETWVGREGSVRVKSARRPSGAVTGKAEIDDVADAPGGQAERERRRREAERAVEGETEPQSGGGDA